MPSVSFLSAMVLLFYCPLVLLLPFYLQLYITANCKAHQTALLYEMYHINKDIYCPIYVFMVHLPMGNVSFECQLIEDELYSALC